MKKDIYIIKNTINDKVYIGQSKDVARRWLHHIYDARYEVKRGSCRQPLHSDIVKYGADKFYYEILESQVSNYHEREKHWIREYHSLVPGGYNISVGGRGTGKDCESIFATFSSRELLLKCVSEISATNKSFTNIAKKYGCSQEVISAINHGKRYRIDGLQYPLRDTDARYPDYLVKQIRYSLKYERDLSESAIAKKYGVDYSQISLINQGKIYYLQSEKYPLREKRLKDLDPETVNSIINDILYSPLCLSDIAAHYNISCPQISNINHGVHYRKDNLTYPLRSESDPRTKSTKKFLDRTIILEICKLLTTEMSVAKIASLYGLSVGTVRHINNGTHKKYIIDGIKYPIRTKANNLYRLSADSGVGRY